MVSIPHYPSGFWNNIHPNGGWVGLGIFWTNNSTSILKKHEGKTFQRYDPMTFGVFLRVLVLRFPPQRWFPSFWFLRAKCGPYSTSPKNGLPNVEQQCSNPNHTKDDHTIAPKDVSPNFICSVRCTRPSMSSKRRGARPMRRCRGTWCLRVLWRIGLWASLSIHHRKNLQLEVENYWPKKCRFPDVCSYATINQFISMCCGLSLGGLLSPLGLSRRDMSIIY